MKKKFKRINPVEIMAQNPLCMVSFTNNCICRVWIYKLNVGADKKSTASTYQRQYLLCSQGSFYALIMQVPAIRGERCLPQKKNTSSRMYFLRKINSTLLFLCVLFFFFWGGGPQIHYFSSVRSVRRSPVFVCDAGSAMSARMAAGKSCRQWQRSE